MFNSSIYNFIYFSYTQVIPDILHMKLRISDILLAEIISLIGVTNTIAERPQHLRNVMTFLGQRAKDTRVSLAKS